MLLIAAGPKLGWAAARYAGPEGAATDPGLSAHTTNIIIYLHDWYASLCAYAMVDICSNRCVIIMVDRANSEKQYPHCRDNLCEAGFIGKTQHPFAHNVFCAFHQHTSTWFCCLGC